MIGQLHYSDVPIGIDAHNFKVPVVHFVSIVLIEAIVALELFKRGFCFIGIIGHGVWGDVYGLRLASQRAGQLVDEKNGALRVVFFMVCRVYS
jgi:hypothetical protein